jgi:membrane-bound lytic murein transglycosylase
LKKLEKKERSLTNIRRELKELETKVEELTEENERFVAMA